MISFCICKSYSHFFSKIPIPVNQILYLLEQLIFWPLLSLLSERCFEQLGPECLWWVGLVLQFVYGKMLVFTIAEKKRGIQVNIFHISPQKHRLLVLIGMPRRDASNEYPQSVFAEKQNKKKKYQNFLVEKKNKKGSVADSVETPSPLPPWLKISILWEILWYQINPKYSLYSISYTSLQHFTTCESV